MTEKTQNRLIVFAIVLGAIALLWQMLRGTPVIKYLESGNWLPQLPTAPSGDIVIEPVSLAPWDDYDYAYSPPTENKGGCGCNAFICPPDTSAAATFNPAVINAALLSAPFGSNLYLGY